MASTATTTAGEDPSPAAPFPDAEILPSVAATLLFVHRRTAVRMMDRGDLTGSRTPGGHRRISLASVHARLRLRREADDAS